jgi:hypothetical protein
MRGIYRRTNDLLSQNNADRLIDEHGERMDVAEDENKQACQTIIKPNTNRAHEPSRLTIAQMNLLS